MKHYALLFRATRTFTPEELKQRPIDIAAWVKEVTDMGITLDPRTLGETVASLSPEGGGIVSGEGSMDPALANILFFDSDSRDQAINIARMHPGLHYGVRIELREWTTPAPLVAR